MKGWVIFYFNWGRINLRSARLWKYWWISSNGRWFLLSNTERVLKINPKVFRHQHFSNAYAELRSIFFFAKIWILFCNNSFFVVKISFTFGICGILKSRWNLAKVENRELLVTFFGNFILKLNCWNLHCGKFWRGKEIDLVWGLFSGYEFENQLTENQKQRLLSLDDICRCF